jgi:hypothetical protein
MSEWKQISQDEFQMFLDSYQIVLHGNINGIFEPPRWEFHDFSDGKVSPESMVGFVKMNDESYPPPKPREYFLRQKLADARTYYVPKE